MLDSEEGKKEEEDGDHDETETYNVEELEEQTRKDPELVSIF